LTNTYCDNQGLVKKINQLCLFRLASASSALRSEYDILTTIHSLLAGLQAPPSIEHVKGHQDDKVTYYKLPLPTQLSCDANVLATQELQEYPTACKHKPLLPAAKVQLSIGGRTITCNLPAIIRHQHGLRLLKTYLYDRFHWRNDTIEAVNWEAFLKAS
jgi:BarA-like signal transduction histidine kinase